MTEPAKTKRQVSYNQDVALCPDCTKRIRLNNNGLLRIHASGKVGSDRCVGSGTRPMARPKMATNPKETNV